MIKKKKAAPNNLEKLHSLVVAETEPPAFSIAAVAAGGLIAALQGTDYILYIDSWISLMYCS